MPDAMTCAGCEKPLPPNKGPGRARKWCSERCRKLTLYSSECRDCGTVINTGGDVAKKPERCVPCTNKHKIVQSRRWILDSIAEWVERFGSPPSSVDWNPQMARANHMTWKAERLEATGRPWPAVSLVQENFGSWNAGLEAAGFPPVKPGEYRDGRTILDVRPSRYWDRDAILDAVQAWRQRTGTVPWSTEWHGAGDDHPSATTVYTLFDSWTELLEAWHERFTPALEAA